jgi:hypothetical protein
MAPISRTGAVLLLLVLGLLAPTRARAVVDHVENGSFDDDVSGWTPVQAFMSISFDGDDVGGDEKSGSALVTFNPTIELDERGQVGQCVGEIAPGRTYVGLASFRIPSGQNRMGSAGLRIAWYPTHDCSGPVSQFAVGPMGAALDAWIDLPATDFVAPDDAFSAQVRLQIEKPVVGQSLVIYFDDVVFLPEPSPELAAGVALLSGAALARCRRRRGSRR